MYKALDDKTMCSLAVKLEPSTALLEFNISRHASHQPPVLQQIIVLKTEKKWKERVIFCRKFVFLLKGTQD
jgi:hypothetical protein